MLFPQQNREQLKLLPRRLQSSHLKQERVHLSPRDSFHEPINTRIMNSECGEAIWPASRYDEVGSWIEMTAPESSNSKGLMLKIRSQVESNAAR